MDEEFNRKNVAIVYIRYKDSCGKDVDHVAIVGRAFTEQMGCFSLVGQTLSLEILPKNKRVIKEQSELLSPASQTAAVNLVLVWLTAYKYSGVG